MIGFVTFFGSSFLLHFVWENLHGPLYLIGLSPPQAFTNAVAQPDFWRLLIATATGDMLFMLVIYCALAAMHRDWLWVSNRETFRHSGTWIIAMLVGILIGISFELWAVHVNHRWIYSEAMPIIPVLEIGLTPVLQMIVVPVLVLLCCRHIISRSK